jgi:hypothetical protein
MKITDPKVDPKAIEQILARFTGRSRLGKSLLCDALVELLKLKPLPLDAHECEFRIGPEEPKFIIGTSK